MSYITRNNAQEQHNTNQPAAKATAPFADKRATTAAQLKQQSLMASSPAVTAQLMLMGKMAGSPIQQKTIQRAGPEEELQMKSAMPAQLAEDEELLQGKFATAQLAEDEELLQGKFETAQRADDEELLQGKFATAQLAEEEELLQGKFEPAPRAEKANNTGLPDNLKSGIESLSGMSMDHVNVHYNSDKPAQLNAHAYAQGADIHVAPGQEQHLPHEAWHVVQQAQGRVNPTTQMKGTSVNDDVGLETEADVMGAKALTTQLEKNPVQCQSADKGVIQKFDAGVGAGWHVHYGDHIKYANNNATRINFAGRTRRQIGFALEQAIQAQGLAGTKANADFIACKTWLRNNVA